MGSTTALTKVLTSALAVASTSTATGTRSASVALVRPTCLVVGRCAVLAGTLGGEFALARHGGSLLHRKLRDLGSWHIWHGLVLRSHRLEVGDRARNILWVLVDIQALIDRLRDGLNLGAQVPLDVVQVEAIFPVDQIDGQAKMTVPAGSTNAMEVGLGILGEIKVDDDVDGLDIDTAGEQIRAHKVSANAIAEIVENAVSRLLGHLGVAVEARISEFGNLLGQQFHSVRRVTEDDGLVDLELGEKGVQAVDFLLLLDESIVLGDTTQRELVHEVDLIRIAHVLVREVFHREGESCREEHDLSVSGVEFEELFDDRCEFNGQKLVSFIHDEHGALAEVGHLLSGQIEDTTWRADDDVDWVLETNNIVPQTSSTCSNHDVDPEMLAKGLADLGCLHGKLSCGDENETLDLGNLGVDLLERGDDEGCGFASTVLGARKDIPAR